MNNAPTPPDGFWPVTVTGWLNTGTSIVALVLALYNIHRHRVQSAVKEAQDEARLIALTDKIAQQRAEVDAQMNRYRASVKHELDGYGRRLERIELTTGEDREVVNGVLQALAEAKENRKYVGDTLVRIEQRLDQMNSLLINRASGAT